MEQLNKYLQDRKLRMIDISHSVNEENIKSYINGLTQNDKVVMYFKRNKNTEKVFPRINIPNELNYYFLYKSLFMVAHVGDEFDEKLKNNIDELLNKII